MGFICAGAIHGIDHGWWLMVAAKVPISLLNRSSGLFTEEHT
jgi:hypothetical protein